MRGFVIGCAAMLAIPSAVFAQDNPPIVCDGFDGVDTQFTTKLEGFADTTSTLYRGCTRPGTVTWMLIECETGRVAVVNLARINGYNTDSVGEYDFVEPAMRYRAEVEPAMRYRAELVARGARASLEEIISAMKAIGAEVKIRRELAPQDWCPQIWQNSGFGREEGALL